MIARWHIGNVKPAGWECLKMSIESFLSLYDADPVICYNSDAAPDLPYHLINQNEYRTAARKPIGVTWKLYPPRLDITQKEIVIDNDVIFRDRILEIDHFLENDCTLLAEDETRAYGRFEEHVPQGFKINSGIYGMPEGFDLHSYVEFFAGQQWEENAVGDNEANKSFDEQGLIAFALLSYHHSVIIPETSFRYCRLELAIGNAMHFMGLNRQDYHRPFQEYKSTLRKMYL